MSKVRSRWAALFDENEDPSEPRYDPVHLATVLVACQVAIGALYWLLWTLLVYEGGLPRKIGALLFRASDPTNAAQSLKDSGVFGGPGGTYALEGLGANLVALVLTFALVAALHRLDRRGAKK